MKKLVFLFVILWLASCQNQSIEQKTNTWNISTQTGIEINTWKTNTWNIASDIEKTVSTWELESTWLINSTWDVDNTNLSDSTWEKDVVIVKNNDNSWTADDFSWKTQQEVVDEMWAYVDDLFNMVEKDVK